jgi:hypothetical protein
MPWSRWVEVCTDKNSPRDVIKRKLKAGSSPLINIIPIHKPEEINRDDPDVSHYSPNPSSSRSSPIRNSFGPASTEVRK